MIKWDRALNYGQVRNQIKDKCRFEMKDWDNDPKYLCVSNSSLHAWASACSGSKFFFFFKCKKEVVTENGTSFELCF